MSKICDLHDHAMDIMNEALDLKAKGEKEKASYLLMQACQLESEAAYQVAKEPETEPSRSMLFLGAASLAYQVKNYELAERLIHEGLSGYPTISVKDELYKLEDEIKFFINSQKIASTITKYDAIFRFVGGKAIGYGRINAKSFMQRMRALEKLFIRGIQRAYNLPFEKQPQKSAHIPKYFLNLGWEAPGSFGVRITASSEDNQLFLDGLDIPSADVVLQNVVNNICLLGTGEEDKIREEIQNEEYFTNFISLAKEILPDGNNICQVRIISKTKTVILTQTKSDLKNIINKSGVTQENTPAEKLVYRGYLKISNGIKGSFTIVNEDNKNEINIHVRDALDELARQYFGEFVEIECEKKKKKLYLLDINQV